MEGRCQVANVSVTLDTIIPGAYISIVPSQLTFISIITHVKHDYFMNIALISVCKNLESLCFSHYFREFESTLQFRKSYLSF